MLSLVTALPFFFLIMVVVVLRLYFHREFGSEIMVIYLINSERCYRINYWIIIKILFRSITISLRFPLRILLLPEPSFCIIKFQRMTKLLPVQRVFVGLCHFVMQAGFVAFTVSYLALVSVWRFYFNILAFVLRKKHWKTYYVNPFKNVHPNVFKSRSKSFY